MDLLTLDFETMWAKDYTLNTMTTEAYVRDPRFQPILIGIKQDNAQEKWLLPDQFARFIRDDVDWANTALLTHHAHFDGAILAWHYGITPALHLDTLSMSRIVCGPKAGNGLEALAPRFGLGEKGTDTRWSLGKRLEDFSPDELQAYGRYCCNDVRLTYELAQIFLPQIPESRLRLIDLKIRMFTEPVFEGDVALLEAAVQEEARRKEHLLSTCGYEKEAFASSDKFAEILRAHGVEPPMKLGKPNPDGSPKPIYAFAKTDPGMQELLEDEDEAIRFLAETRLAVKSTIIETRAQRFLDCARRGPMPVYIKPHGAHTHRGGGGDKMNWQNMTSVNKLRPEMTVLKRSIRAPAGCKIVAADSAQIQARLVAWLAGQDDLIAAFAAGEDVYSGFASDVYHRPVDRKNNPDDFIPGQVGKISILGFGFGMGYLKAAAEFLKGKLGAPPIQFTQRDMERMEIDPSPFLNNPRKVQEVEAMPSRLALNDRLMHCIVTEALVLRYRQKYANIKALWELMEGVINHMIAGRDVTFGPGGVLRTSKDSIWLPSGLRLHYRDLQRDARGEASYWNGRSRAHIYGGYATENVVQALEQEIIGDNQLEIAARGYKLATETHDEIVCVVPDEAAPQCLATMFEVMKRPPLWAPTLPLNAEGAFGDCYGELK